MKTGDIVKYKNELPEDTQARERGFYLRVAWIDRERTCVECVIPDMTFNPRYIVNTDEIEQVKQ